MRQLRAFAGIVVLAGVLAACGGAAADPSQAKASPESTPLAVESLPPEPTPGPTPKPLAVKVTKVTKSVAPGKKASVTIKTKKGAKCSISVMYESGESEAKGLGNKKADANGKVAWSWLVGRNTNPGEVPISIWCTLGDAAGEIDTSFTVK